jgi:hypothetical protein
MEKLSEKKNHVGNPMSYTTTSWEKMLTTSYNPLIATLGMISWEKKKRENLSIHWFTGDHFPKVWFISGPFLYSNPPKNKKNAEKCSSHVQNIAKLTVQIYLVLL